jgi:hypothetical protein
MKTLSSKTTWILVLTLVGLGPVEAQAQAGTEAQGTVSFGGGLHYLRNLGDITNDDAIDLSRNSFALVGSVKGAFGGFGVDGQVGYIFDYVGTGEPAWEPSIWGLLGSFVYGGAGIGWQYHDGDWSDEPFYALRAGVALPLGSTELDVYGSWRFQGSEDFENLTGEDLDSITFAAILRFIP